MKTVDIDEITTLIASKQEGGYWDFKSEWYSSDSKGKQDMLHDIICMANNIVGKDGYIIIGVDESQDFAVTGIGKDKNRRTTQNIVDFLRDKKFAGSFRPMVSVSVLDYYGINFDVITVHSDNNTPYYLSESFQGIFANNVYARIQDTNTPVNRSADIHDIEKLWRKRFGLDKTALERLSIVLSDYQNWEYKSDRPHYHKLFPEFHIEYPELEIYEDGTSEPNEISHARESGFYINSRAFWYKYRIYYHSTFLHDSIYHTFDETRIKLSNYDYAVFYNGEWRGRKFSYNYFEKESIEGKMLRLFTLGDNAHERCDQCRAKFDYCPKCSIFGNGAFLVFDNADSRKAFETYVSDNLDTFDALKLTYGESVMQHEENEGYHDKNVEDWLRLYQMLLLWERV